MLFKVSLSRDYVNIPFCRMSTPFGAHHAALGQGSSTASYFGDGEVSPTSNPFAFVGAGATPSLGLPGQSVPSHPSHPMNPLTGYPTGHPPNLPPPPMDSSGDVPVGLADNQWTPSQVSPFPTLTHQRSSGSLPVNSASSVFTNEPGELEEDPFAAYSSHPPRSKSSQAQNRDPQVNTHDIFGGSASAPVTGLVATAQLEQDRNLLDHPIFQPQSLPSSSSGSSIERPPLNPRTITNAEIPGSQSGYFPVVHSYPHLQTNATNAIVDTSQPTVSSHPTNAVGYPTTPPQSVPKDPPADSLGMSEIHALHPSEGTLKKNEDPEKDFLMPNKDKMHGFGLLEGENSLSSSMNQSMSSLLESQEDITHSPVQILPPAPVAQSLPPLNPSSQEHSSHSMGQVTPTNTEEVEVETPRAATHEGERAQLDVHSEVSSETQAPILPPPPQPMQLGHSLPQPSFPTGVSSHPLPLSDPLNAPPHTLPQTSAPPNLAPSNHPTPASSGYITSAVQKKETGTSFPIVSESRPDEPLPETEQVDQQMTTQRRYQDASTLPELAQERNLPVTYSSHNVVSTSQPPAPSSHVYSGATISTVSGDVTLYGSVQSTEHLEQQQQQHDTHFATTSQVMPAPDPVQVLPSQDGSNVGATLSHVQSMDNSTLHQKSSSVQLGQLTSVTPMLPPSETENSVLSNAHIASQSQPSVPSNAHPLSQLHYKLSNAQPPPSEASGQGVLSNAHLPQYTPSDVHPPAAMGVAVPTPSDMQEVTQLHSQQGVVSSTTGGSTAIQEPPPHLQHTIAVSVVTTTSSAPPLFTQPSTPDSVFLQTTLVDAAAPALSGVTTNAGAPYRRILSPDTPSETTQAQTSVPAQAPSVYSEVQTTQIQTSVPAQLDSRGVVTQTHPTVSALLSSVQPNTQVPSSQVQSRVPLHLQATQQVQHVSAPVNAPPTQHTYSNTNAVDVAISRTIPAPPTNYISQSMRGSSSEPGVQQRQVVTSVHQIPSSSVASTTVHQPHSSVSSGPVSGLTRSIVTAPVAVLDQHHPPSSLSHPHRHTGEQLPPNSVQPPPHPSTSHPRHPTAEPPRAPHHPSLEYSARPVGEPWRHPAEVRHPLRERERYYYMEDPYGYERGGPYVYEDPYYEYYRERPGSRAPYIDRYSYYPEPYEYAYDRLYHRRLKQWDPYLGQYVYVDDSYMYDDPQVYEQYIRDLHGHGHQPGPGVNEQDGIQGYTEEHAHDVSTAYPDQSTISGTQNVFEEGGTFVNSPNVQKVAHGHLQQPPYPEYPQYDQEPPIQPLWASIEEPPEAEPQEPPVILRRTPELFAHPHVRASFGPGGTLVVVLPHNLRAFQRAEVELSHVSESIGNTELAAGFVETVSEFPGPLMPGETPKSVAVGYATSQAEQCCVKQQVEEGEDGDAEKAKELCDEALLWDFLVLLCQQNGVVVASDISELLTREKMTEIPSRTHMGSGNQEDALESIRQLLIAGRKRDALELACSRCLWGHALMLASKMDEQSRTYVINRFTASLITTDPLSTFYTLMLGRTPSAVKPDGLRRAGNWRPHLAMILANRSNKLDNISIVTMGDSLLESGRLCAAHFCYHLADTQFGPYGSITSKYLLLGVQNSLLSCGRYPRPEYLRKMEVFEYAMSLGKHEFVLPHFQVFKYLLALQLTQAGMISKAFKYCEQIAAFISRSPGKFPPTLLHLVGELSTQLHHLNHPHGVVETELPSWLLHLQQTASDVLAGNYASSTRSTPSPAFSSVSQAYGARQNVQHAFGQGNQYLKVPGGSYKGDSVDTSTAASSKEGSMVVGIPTQATAAEQNATYQPSPLVQQQQQVTEYTQTQEQLQTNQLTSDGLYSQNTQVQGTEEDAPVINDSTAAVPSSGVPYYVPDQTQGQYSDGYPPNTAEGGGEITDIQPFQSTSNQQVMNAIPDSTAPVEFGTTSTALPSEQQAEQPLYNGSQQQMFNPYQGYDNQQTIEQPSQQLGYGHQVQPEVGSTLGHVYQPSMQQTAQFPPPTSEPMSMYSGAGYWEQQYPPQTEQYESGGSGGVDETDAPLITGQSGGNREERETRKEAEEEVQAKENKDRKNEGISLVVGLWTFL